jgi:hypothetical protein
MKRLGDLKVVQALGRKCGNATSRLLTPEEIAELSNTAGELDPKCGRWYSAGGLPASWRYVDAIVDMTEIDEPAFNSNTSPVDSSGNRLTHGDYEVLRGSEKRLATVFETEDNELLVRFAGSDRTQRVDECSRAVTWNRITTSDVR